MVVSNRNLLFQGVPIFRGELLVSGRVDFGAFFSEIDKFKALIWGDIPWRKNGYT